MGFRGAQVAIHIGPLVTRSAPSLVLDRLQQLTVSLDDAGKSGFQLTFGLARDRLNGKTDYPLLAEHHLKIGTRVQITGLLNGTAHPLMDGVVTNQQFSPSKAAGETTLTVTGEDVTAMLDLVELKLQLPAPGYARVLLMLAPLAAFGVVPKVIPPVSDLPPLRPRLRPGAASLSREGWRLRFAEESLGELPRGVTKGVHVSYSVHGYRVRAA